jgi:hypothetical protein
LNPYQLHPDGGKEEGATTDGKSYVTYGKKPNGKTPSATPPSTPTYYTEATETGTDETGADDEKGEN